MVKRENHPNYGRSSPFKGLTFPERQGEKSPFYGIPRHQETKDRISKNRIESGIASGCNNPRARKVIDTETMEIYCSVEDACNAHNIVRSTFNRYMNGKIKNTSPLMYLEEYIKLNPNFKTE